VKSQAFKLLDNRQNQQNPQNTPHLFLTDGSYRNAMVLNQLFATGSVIPTL